MRKERTVAKIFLAISGHFWRFYDIRLSAVGSKVLPDSFLSTKIGQGRAQHVLKIGHDKARFLRRYFSDFLWKSDKTKL